MKSGSTSTEITQKRNLIEIWHAIARNDIEWLNQLIADGADVNAFSFNIHCEEEYPLLYAIRLGHISCAYTLIQAGACLDNVYIGSNPLHYAILHDQTEIAIMLIKAGANLEIRFDDMTPLHHAICAKKGAIVKCLIENNANITALYKEAMPIDWAIFYHQPKIVDLLINVGATIEADYASQWHFNLNNHYKCWFSKHPDEFLDAENQFRLIRLREINPHISITLIYSSKYLNQYAKNNLYAFCEAHKINALDFDKDIKALINTDEDIALYQLAQQEIRHAVENNGGNLASASDITRFMIAIIEKCGMYNDFEQQLTVNQAHIICKTPIVLNFTWEGEVMNNDCVAVALQNSSSLRLAKVAVEMIQSLQKRIVENYNNFGKAMLDSEFLQKYPSIIAILIRGYINNFPKASLFDFRRFFEKATKMDIANLINNRRYCITEYELDKIKERILKVSVVAITGPSVLYELFKSRYIKYYPHCGHKQNMKDIFTGENDVFANTVQRKQGFDLSWTRSGEDKKREMSEKIIKNITSLQSHVRKCNAQTEYESKKKYRNS